MMGQIEPSTYFDIEGAAHRIGNHSPEGMNEVMGMVERGDFPQPYFQCEMVETEGRRYDDSIRAIWCQDEYDEWFEALRENRGVASTL